MHSLLADTYTELKSDLKNKYLKSNFALTLADLQRGFNRRLDNEILNGAFLALGQDKNALQIYNIYSLTGHPLPATTPHISVGVGMDTAEEELYSFVKGLSREERKNIKPIEGLSALLYATNLASQRNSHIGGTPMIAVLKDKKVIMPSEHNSKLATEIVLASKHDFLPRIL